MVGLEVLVRTHWSIRQQRSANKYDQRNEFFYRAENIFTI